MKIKCTVCNKEFYYGDHNSPMFIDEELEYVDSNSELSER